MRFLSTKEKYRNWVENPYEDPDEIRIYQLEGHVVNRRIGYVSDGIFMTQEEIDNHPIDQDQANNTTLLPGDIKYKDLNNDGVINWRDQKNIGYNSFPNLSFGLNFNADYKGISLSALFEGASQFTQYIDYFPFDNFSQPMEFHWDYSWRADPNDPTVNLNPDAILPAILGDGTGRNFNNDKMSDFWMQDATYVRLKELNLGYSIPERVLQKIGFEALRISISATNILTFSKLGIYKSSVDPEAVDRNQWSYPPVKTFSLGLNLML